MAYDAIVCNLISTELDKTLNNGKIDKVSMPSPYDVILTIRAGGCNRKLLLSCSPSNPRVHFTNQTFQNPTVPPMFCMLLRKHLSGGRILDIKTIDMERVIIFSIESRDETFEVSKKHLILELVSRQSNIILTDCNDKILGCAKHVDLTLSTLRPIFGGLLYTPPIVGQKHNLLSLSKQQINDITSKWNNREVADLIVDNFYGIAPVIANELALNNDISSALFELATKIKNRKFCPIITSKDGEYKDFFAFDIKQYMGYFDVEKVDVLSEKLDDFFLKKFMEKRKKELTSDIAKLIDNALVRVKKKIALQQNIIKDSDKMDVNKVYGDIISANIYQLKLGDGQLKTINFYNGEEITIPLDRTLSPSQNATKYYARYTKLKSSLLNAKIWLENAQAELDYLLSVSHSLDLVSTPDDLESIKSELVSTGYIRKKTQNKKTTQKSGPIEFLSSDGYKILVGRNNVSNDTLTISIAKKHDIWLHTKQIHGSHTIVVTNGENVPKSTLIEAAIIAAFHSKARQSSNVDVDYTTIKNVKKPSGAKPGKVIYENYKTLTVTPNFELVQNLRI